MPSHDRPTEDQLREWIATAWQLLANADTYEVRAEAADRFKFLWGPCAQAVRYATAWSSLSRTEHRRESDVLARSALEHALTAQWCHFTPDGVKRLQVKVQKEHYGYFSQMAEWQDLDEIKEAMQDQTGPAPGGDDSLPNFYGKIIPLLDSDNFLAASYRALSRSVHVNDSTVLSFLVPDGAGLAVTPAPDSGDGYPAAYVAATSALLALAVIADHLRQDTLLRQLNDVSNDLKLVMFLNQERNDRMQQQYDGGPPPE